MNLPLLVIDANVLIDFQSAGIELIGLLVRHIGPLQIPREVLGEVEGLDEETVVGLGATVVEASLEDGVEATAEQLGALSYPDAICLVLARKTGLTCITNDKALRARCSAAGVSLIWGLEAIIKIHKAGGMSRERALDYARRIQVDNPLHITEAIMGRFQGQLS